MFTEASCFIRSCFVFFLLKNDKIFFISTFGIRGHLWKYAARTAVTTLQASIGGGLMGMSISWYKNRQLEIADVINSVLGALVSITGRRWSKVSRDIQYIEQLKLFNISTAYRVSLFQHASLKIFWKQMLWLLRETHWWLYITEQSRIL